MPIHRSINHDFFKKWSSDMAYVLGFFTADGCMIKNKRGGRYIEFYITDKELLWKIGKAMGSKHKITKRIRGDNWKAGYRLQIGSNEIFDDLIKLGISPKKSLTIKFPDIPKEYLGDFVRGYFDGDGCVSFTKYWRKDRSCWYWSFTSRFTSGSRRFLDGLWKNLMEHGNIHGGNMHCKNRGLELVFSRTDSLALFKLMYNNVASGLYLKRKYSIFIKAFEKLDLGT